MTSRPLAVVGTVIKPHGLDGEFSMVAHLDSPVFFDRVSRLYLRAHPRAHPRRVRVQSWRVHKSRLLIRLEEVAGRDEAELLRGAELLARQEDIPAREEGVLFQEDLIGCRVFLSSGEQLGRIQAVSEAGKQELWTIHTEEGREVLFPAHDDLLLEVDLDHDIIRINPPPGLLELYLGPQPASIEGPTAEP